MLLLRSKCLETIATRFKVAQATCVTMGNRLGTGRQLKLASRLLRLSRGMTPEQGIPLLVIQTHWFMS